MWKKGLSRSEIAIRNKKLFFNFDNASYAFINILNKYKKTKRAMKQFRQFNIVNLFDQERKKAENKETEEDYIYKDLQYLRKVKEELQNEYGEKSKEEVHDIDPSKFKVKMPKNLFLDMFENHSLQKNNSLRTNSNNIITLPSIIKQKRHNNSININRYDKEEKENDELFHKIKSTNITSLNSIRIEDNNITEPNHISQVESLNNSNVLSDVNRSVNYNYLRRPKNQKKMNYVQTLELVKNDFMNEEKSFKKLFCKYDYGIAASNQKYNFMMKKYFD
jgi:hypothetical protein